MTTDFTRFKTPDNVGLPDWLTSKDSDTAVIHIHPVVEEIV